MSTNTTTAPVTTIEPVPCKPSDSSVSWMLVATVLVLGMLPGLAFFEAGLLRGKNTISITVQVFSGTAVLCTMWIAFGYTLSFSGDAGGAGIIGDFDNFGLRNVGYDDCFPGTVIPTALYALFQMMFAAITPLLMTGAFAERLAWKPFIILMMAWELIVYYPVAHWIWSPKGWLAKMGAQDFAGGIVIHITAGVSSLVAVGILGKRHDFHKHHGEAPYSSLPIACIGASLLWTGWFGFNGGSALASGDLAIHAVMNSQLAASICSCCFLAVSMYRTGRPSIIAVINGAIAGLAGVTPAAGYVSLGWGMLLAVVIAIFAHISMYFVKHKWQIDDALDVSCVHGVPGLVGAIWLGFFANTEVGGNLNGVAYGGGGKLIGAQFLASFIAAIWAGFWTFVILKVTSLFLKLRVTDAAERGGLDLFEHNEVAWLVEKVSPTTSFAVVPIKHGADGKSVRTFRHDGDEHENIEDMIRSRAILVVESRETHNARANGSESSPLLPGERESGLNGEMRESASIHSSMTKSRSVLRVHKSMLDDDNGGYGNGM